MNDEKEIIEQVNSEVAIMAGIQITTREEYDHAAGILMRLKTMAKNVSDFFSPMVKAAHEAHKAVKARENEAMKPIEAAETDVKRKMSTWYAEQERIRVTAEIKAAEERRAAEEKIEAARKEAATLAELSGEEVDILFDTAPALKVIVPEQVKIAGVSQVKVWNFEITDPAALPREFLIPDEAKIRRVVAAMKGDTNIPGVKVVEGYSTRGRA
jgi:hypothetical protein